MIRAVLFDLDGTLVDTEDLGVDTAILVCKEYGINLTKEEKSNFIGITDMEFYKRFFEKKQLSLDVNQALSKHEKIYEEELSKTDRFFEGVPELLHNLNKSGYKLGLITGATRRQVDIIFKDISLLALFETIVTADDVKKSKPDPEGYLLGMKKLNVTPIESIVIEESKMGIQAGISAGVKVIGIKNLGGQDISQATFQVKDIKELSEKLFELNQ